MVFVEIAKPNPNKMEELSYKIHKSSNKVEIQFFGDILGDTNIKEQLLKEIDLLISDNILQCDINLSDVNYIDSSGLGLLIVLLTKFRNKGGDVVLINLSEHVKNLLLITKLNSIFEVK